MTTKFQKVVGAVKDHTSIGLALVALRGSSTTIEIAVLKATSHDEVPVDDRYATEVLLLASSSPCAAAATAFALRRRMTRTSSWVVALKTLNVIYTTILDAGPDFRREAAMRRLLDLSSFRSTPWDFTAFVRTYALYLDARLQSSLKGYISLRRRRRRPSELKPAIILDRIQQWQQLLDRAVGTRPTGPAKTNRLVQISLCSVVRESFDLYHDVAGGLSLLLDNFFQLPYPSCVATAEACRKTAKLFEDLNEFYALCKKIGIGRDSEYPIVQKISKKLLERLNEFLRDQQDSGNPTLQVNSSPQIQLLAPQAESVLGMVVRMQGNSADEGQKKLETERSLSMVVRRQGNSADEGQKKLEGNSADEGHKKLETESALSMAVRRQGNSADDGQKKLETDISPPKPSIPLSTTNPFLDGGKTLALYRASSAREEKGSARSLGRCSFENSAWIQNKLDEKTRQKLIHEQQQWMQHQNRMMERNLAFL